MAKSYLDTIEIIVDFLELNNILEEKFKENKEFEERFVPKKKKSLLLAESYKRLDYFGKYESVKDCGTFLEYVHVVDSNKVKVDGKLNRANFCKDRLCPMCNWRRSYKIFSQVSQIMSVIANKYQFLFLTLTVPNCEGFELKEKIDMLLKSWRKLTMHKKYKEVVQGAFRALEITRNKENGSFHPHFHVVLAVPLDYFVNSGLYMSHDVWLQMWRKATGDDSIKFVNIKKMRGKKDVEGQECSDYLASAVAESAKYAVKDSDYIISDDNDLTDILVYTLSNALHRRQLVNFSGIFAETRRNLNLDDAEDGDLVHIDGKIEPSLSYMIVRYGWSTGCYKMVDNFIVDNDFVL